MKVDGNLRRDNLTLYEQYVKLFLEGSKTDVYREGRDVLISKTNSNTYPVNTLLRYLYIFAFICQMH
jgi:hypothetical protein